MKRLFYHVFYMLYWIRIQHSQSFISFIQAWLCWPELFLVKHLYAMLYFLHTSFILHYQAFICHVKKKTVLDLTRTGTCQLVWYWCLVPLRPIKKISKIVNLGQNWTSAAVCQHIRPWSDRYIAGLLAHKVHYCRVLDHVRMKWLGTGILPGLAKVHLAFSPVLLLDIG